MTEATAKATPKALRSSLSAAPASGSGPLKKAVDETPPGTVSSGIEALQTMIHQVLDSDFGLVTKKGGRDPQHVCNDLDQSLARKR